MDAKAFLAASATASFFRREASESMREGFLLHARAIPSAGEKPSLCMLAASFCMLPASFCIRAADACVRAAHACMRPGNARRSPRTARGPDVAGQGMRISRGHQAEILGKTLDTRRKLHILFSTQDEVADP